MKKLLHLILGSLIVCSSVSVAERQESDDERLIDDPRVQHRSYVFPDTGEAIPYAVFVPSGHDQNQASPLIVSLHGLGRSYDWLMGYQGFLDQAEANDYILVTPLGYIRRGWYGSRETEDPLDAQRSEQDVLNVLQLIRDEYTIDPDRIYLWGHSMGGAGTYHIAAKYPDIFAGLGVAAPAAEANAPMDEILERIKHLPILVLQGDQDDAVPVERTRAWVAKMQEFGMQHIYVEIPEGDHSLLISQNKDNMQKFVDFFNIVRKQYF